MALLEVCNLKHSFGKKTVLNDVNLTGDLGQIIGVFGRNGSGKSTLLNILFKQLRLQSGTILINNQPLKSVLYRSQVIGYLPQNLILPRELKVRDAIAMCCPDGEAQDLIFYAKGIAAISNKYVYQLSQGNLKYLSALIVVNLPHPILLLDEPFSMIDPLIKESFRDLLIQKKKEKLIILTDHYYQDVFDISDKKIVIDNGVSYPANSLTDLRSHSYLL